VFTSLCSADWHSVVEILHRRLACVFASIVSQI
jgi:hypothetical protein